MTTAFTVFETGILLLFCAALTVCAATATYTETFDPGTAPDQMMEGILGLGDDGPWSGRVDNARYILENRSDPYAVTYYYFVPAQTFSRGPVDVSVDIGGNFRAGEYHSGAGLIYGFDEQRRTYYAFVIMENGQYGFFERDAEGFQERISGTHGAIRREGSNTLSIQSGADGFSLRVNGSKVADYGSSQRGRGVGLLALGKGTYEFDNFTMRASGTRQPSPSEPENVPDRPQDEQDIDNSDERHGLLLEGTGVREIATTDAAGAVLCLELDHERSARQALRNALPQFRRCFRNRFQASAAAGDQEDRDAQVLFRAEHNNTPVAGMLMVYRTARGCAAVCVFDTPDRIARNLGQMMDFAARELPPPFVSPPRPTPRMRRVSLPDGSGTMSLPDGWHITGGQGGAVDAIGQDGSQANLGIAIAVFTPQQANSIRQMVGHTDGVFIGQYSDPVQALQQLFPQFPAQQPQQLARIIETMPTPWPQGQAAFIHFEWQKRQQPYQSLALVGTMPGPAQWMFYLSAVSAPSHLFEQNLPTLMEIWKSWKVADHVLKGRLNKAAQTMRSISGIINRTYQNRQRTLDRVADDWTEVIRGSTYVRDTRLGELHEAPLHDIDKMVDGLNEAAGYQRYQHIPLRDL